VQNINFLPKDTIAQPSFWKHNFRLGYQPTSGRFEIAGWVRNLTDEEVKTFAFDGSTFTDTTIYFVGDPRTYGITAIFNF
jgi:outer membrane receptor protein involved in Fe transport